MSNSAKLTFAAGARCFKVDDKQFTADEFCEHMPARTWFEIIPTPETPVKPYFDVDYHCDDKTAVPSAEAAAAEKAKAVALIREHFPVVGTVHCCQRVKPGKISFHFVCSGVRTTTGALLKRLKTIQGGKNNAPFDLAPYMSYQKWNAPNQAKGVLENGELGPVMAVEDGSVKDNLITHLEGTEKQR